MSDNDLGQFLRARRDQVAPEGAGPGDDGRRRVPGLRREELALASGVSPSYYVRLEQGRTRHPSPQVLDALARALRLDADASRHLRTLAEPAAAGSAAGAERRSRERVRPELARLLDHHVGAPAFVLGRRMDVLAANALARALHPSFAPGRNVVADAFLDADAQARYADLADVRRHAVASLRAATGRRPHDDGLTRLVGRLSVDSAAFRELWARHEVRTKIAGTKRFDHPATGPFELDYESLAVSGTGDQQLIVYHADPAGAEARVLSVLGLQEHLDHP